MLILAVDTAGPNCAACVYDTNCNVCLSSISKEIGRGHAEVLPGIVQQVLKHANLTFADLNLMAVSEGPGSFAGIRVGISFVRALSLALQIPSIGVSSLIAMVDAVRKEAGQDSLAAIDASRGEVYLCKVASDGLIIIDPSKYSIEDANALLKDGKFLLCGNGTRVLDTKQCQIMHQNASAPIETIAKLAAKAVKTSGHQASRPKPQYLRAADAKKQAGFVLDRV